jgi:AraC family transcriptional regulator
MSAHLHSITTAVAFIEDHLQEKINVADMASAASYSLYHFCRIFNQTVHHSPYDYLMRRRLTCAARELVMGHERITDIAFAYQFGSPESFSRAFRRMFGQLPTQWRKTGIRDDRVLMRPLTPAHLALRNRADFRRPALVTLPTLTLVGLMTLAETPTARGKLAKLLDQPPTHMVHHYPDHWAEHGRLLFMGHLGEKASATAVWQTLPTSAYARFHLPPTPAERQHLTNYIYQTWLPQSDHALAAPFELEHIPDQHLFIPLTASA